MQSGGEATTAALPETPGPGTLPTPQKPRGLPPPSGCSFPRLPGVSQALTRTRGRFSHPQPMQTRHRNASPSQNPRRITGPGQAARLQWEPGGHRGRQRPGTRQAEIPFILITAPPQPRVTPGVPSGPGRWQGSEACGRLVVDVVGGVAPHGRHLRLEDAAAAAGVGAGGHGQGVRDTGCRHHPPPRVHPRLTRRRPAWPPGRPAGRRGGWRGWR